MTPAPAGRAHGMSDATPPDLTEQPTAEQPTAEPATSAGTTTAAGAGASVGEVAEQVASQTDSLSPNADRAGTRERAVDPDQSGD